jgi:hypothetical protein
MFSLLVAVLRAIVVDGRSRLIAAAGIAAAKMRLSQRPGKGQWGASLALARARLG